MKMRKGMLVKLLALHIALFPFIPDAAQAASKFLVLCTTACNWDNTNDTIWSTTSGGANNTTHPVAGDDVTINASSCVGGVTCAITTGAVTIAINSVTWGACTATTTGCIIDASANNTNFTIGGGSGVAFSGTGAGTRKWLAGTGTYALSSANANGCFSMASTGGDTGSVFSGATWSCSGATTNGRGWAGGGFSFGPMTFNGNSSNGSTIITGANTWASLTFVAPQFVSIPNGTTQTVTGALTVTGSSASSLVVLLSNGQDSIATISLGSASTGTWASFRAITTSGAAALTVSNCIDMGRNTFANGGSCTAPSGGGTSDSKIIGSGI